MAVALKDLVKMAKGEFKIGPEDLARAFRCSESGGRPGEEDRIFVFVDPVCGVCREVADMFVKFRERCPSVIPQIEFILAPSAEPISRRTASILEAVRTTKPSYICGALFDAMANVGSSDVESLANFESAYTSMLGVELLVPSTNFVDYKEARPFVVYRGRLVRRTGMFNPLAGETEILYTLLTIRGLSGG